MISEAVLRKKSRQVFEDILSCELPQFLLTELQHLIRARIEFLYLFPIFLRRIFLIHEVEFLVPESDAQEAIAASDAVAAELAISAVFAILAPEATVAFRHIDTFVAKL